MNKKIIYPPEELGIFYYGASGGFFSLYLLLLSRQLNCVFTGQSQDLDSVMQQHWNLQSIDTWKKTEIWPDNDATKLSAFSNKIYYFCNPKKSDFDNFTGTRIVIYTDIDTQYYFASTKRAYWFVGKTLEDFQNPSFALSYFNVKDSSWPDCYTIQDFEKLPLYIKQECLDIFNFSDIVDEKKFSDDFKNNLSSVYRGERVDLNLLNTINIDAAEIKIKLQDLIKDSGKSIYRQLGLTHSKVCNDFTEFYVNLHTTEQKIYLVGQ
jgi:hypothetical protein